MPTGSTEGKPGIVIALGSNTGDTLNNLRTGAAQLRERLGLQLRLSRPWLTDPVDCPPGSPRFANAAAVADSPSGFEPIVLLQELKRIEQLQGRRPKLVINEPRPIDLDLICFGDETLNTAELILPHPRAHERHFVLAPLAELCPRLVFPGHRCTVKDYLDHCDRDASARPIESFSWEPSSAQDPTLRKQD